MNWDDRLQYEHLTDIGMRRLSNQDAHLALPARDMAEWNDRGHFFMVADGMGAHAAGELASRLAVDGVHHLYKKYTDLSPPEALQKAVLETNSEINRRGTSNTDFHNMGTTASVLVLLPQGALIAHIGDSRVYRLRRDRLHQLTRDHSLAWELRDQLPDNGDLAIPKNVITRSLGPNASVQVDMEGPLPLEPGDTFLLCSDGLTGRVADEELASLLDSLSPDEAARLLIDLANLRGGPDNITVIVAKFLGEEVGGGDSEPIRIGAVRGRSPVQPAVWVCLAVCLLAALVLAITNNAIPALVAVCGAVAALLVGLIAHQRSKMSGITLAQGRRLGKCPYTETVCSARDKSVNMLRDIARELRGGTQDDLRSVDWTEFDSHCQAARQAEDTEDHAAAMACYSRAIRCAVRELRDRQNKRAGDSSIDF